MPKKAFHWPGPPFLSHAASSTDTHDEVPY